MIKNDIDFNAIEIQKGKYVCLGTPLQLKYFYNNFPAKSCMDLSCNFNNMRICFDLDNTLVTFPKVTGDYTTVEPIDRTINYLRYLKSFGHTIIIYTARRMKTHKGNTGKILADVGRITFDTLEKFSIPYDEIYFGKPHADVYIDDLGLCCFDDLEKELGFYMDTVKPRDFNNLSSRSIETYRKESDDLSGEIYYYKHIPRELKDLFPLFVSFDENNTWYEIEKINGLTASILFTSELLTKTTLRCIMDAIIRIQNCKYESADNICIYDNYSRKLQNRFDTYDYSSYQDSSKTFDEINKYLLEYEQAKRGRKTVIHGDPVLTNIIINPHDKIKMIDMRGKVGSTLTICGDWLYDWAKLYQSLIGYDFILLRKEVSPSYQKSILEYFESQFVALYGEQSLFDLKMITRSLLFSLIPLHDNENCDRFYNLINHPQLL